MSFEAITSIAGAEADAKAAAAAAELKSKQMLSDAEAAGKASVEAAAAKADEELIELRRKAAKPTKKLKLTRAVFPVSLKTKKPRSAQKRKQNWRKQQLS